MSTTERDRGELWGKSLRNPRVERAQPTSRAVSSNKFLRTNSFQRAGSNKLQRSQEIQQILHLRAVERIESPDYRVGFGAAALAIAVGRGMCLNDLHQVCGSSIVQEEEALAQAPERSSAELVRTGRSLVNPIRQTRPPVMESKVGVRMISNVRHSR